MIATLSAPHCPAIDKARAAGLRYFHAITADGRSARFLGTTWEAAGFQMSQAGSGWAWPAFDAAGSPVAAFTVEELDATKPFHVAQAVARFGGAG